MVQTTITYFLPRTRAWLQATVQTKTDSVLNKSETATTAYTTSLVTSADPARQRTLTIQKPWLRDHSFTIGLTEDGRLTKAGVESVGQVGTLLAAGATIAGLVAGGLPAALAAAVAAARVPAADQPLGSRAEPEPPADPALAAYREQHRELADRLTRLAAGRVAAARRLDRARDELLTAVDDPPARAAAGQKVLALKNLLTDIDADLDRAWTHFHSWRATTQTTSTDVYDEMFELSRLPTWSGGELQFGEGRQAAKDLFDKTGRMLAVVEYDDDGISTPATGQPDRTDVLHIPRPRPLVLAHVERAADRLRVTGYNRALVMDAGCGELLVPIRKSWFAKRRIDATLSELGAMTELSYNGASSAAAAATALAELPDRVGTGLDQATTIATGVETARAWPEQREIGALKRQIELRQQQLVAAGQTATAQDYTELERLRQAKEIAELRAALRSRG